jgi:fructose-bisphosphate aldolase class I
MNAAGPLPWPLTFSYGRALQDTALKAWGGAPSGLAGGQQQLSIRAKLNSLAAGGTYKSAMESSTA